MGWISIENVEFFAYHGVYAEERLTGNTFLVDVHVESAFDSNTLADDLSETLNYETIFHCCKKVMHSPKQLLETVCIDIVKALKHQFPDLLGIRVKIRKQNPMPGEKIGSSAVEIAETFVRSCPSCGSRISCYTDENCWCNQLTISDNARKTIQEKYKGCLCPQCLQQYAD